MSTITTPVRTLVTGISTALLLLVTAVVGGTAAWAGPAPLEPEPAPAGGGTVIDLSTGIATWQIVAIGLASALVAIAVTMVVSHLVSTHQRGSRHPAHA